MWLFVSFSGHPEDLFGENGHTNCYCAQSGGARLWGAGWLHLHCKHEAERLWEVGGGNAMLCPGRNDGGNSWNLRAQELSQARSPHSQIQVLVKASSRVQIPARPLPSVTSP